MRALRTSCCQSRIINVIILVMLPLSVISLKTGWRKVKIHQFKTRIFISSHLAYPCMWASVKQEQERERENDILTNMITINENATFVSALSWIIYVTVLCGPRDIYASTDVFTWKYIHLHPHEYIPYVHTGIECILGFMYMDGKMCAHSKFNYQFF
jgi:hypothetical protein